MCISKRFKLDYKPTRKLNDVQKNGIKEFLKKDYSYIEKKECPICQKEDFEVLSEKDRYGLPLRVVICKYCGLVFANPYFDNKSLKEFYNHDSPKIYRSYDISDPEESLKNYYNKQYYRGEAIFEFIKKHAISVNNLTIIEIGAGAGGILSFLKDQGNKVLGVDYAKQYIEYGKDKGVDLNFGSIDKIIESDIKADIVIYSDVIEHIPSINSELQKVKKIMKSNGLLYLKVPSIKNLKNYHNDFLMQLQNAHIYYFSLASLTNILNINGFELIYGDETTKALFKKGETSSNFISDYENVKKYLIKMEIRNTKYFTWIRDMVKKSISKFK